MKKSSNITVFDLIIYGLVALPMAFSGIPLYLHAPDFYAGTLGISLTKVGIILLALRFIDAIQDPIIGKVSDKLRKHRLKLVAFGIGMLSSGFFMLFNPLVSDEFVLLIWFGVSIFIATTGFSIAQININTIGGIWSDNYDEKTKISTFREGLGLIGLIVAAALPSILTNIYNNEDAFQKYAIFMIFISLVTTSIFLIFTNYKETNSNGEVTSWANILEAIKENKRFFLTYFISIVASSIPAVLVIFFIRDKLNLEENIGLFLAVYFLSGAASMPAWNKVAKGNKKLKAWRLSMIIAITTFGWAFFLEEGDFYQFLIICIASGFAFGAELALPPAILADNLSEGSESTEYSVLGFLLKFGLAVATGLMLPALDFFGFETKNNNSEEALVALSVFYALVPCAIKFIAMILILNLEKQQGITKGFKHEKNINSNDINYVAN